MHTNELGQKKKNSRSLVRPKFQNAGLKIYFFKSLLYLMDYFNTVLKRPSMKLAGTSMPFCKWWTQADKFILNSIYLENHEYLMRCGNMSGTQEIRIFLKYIDAGGSKSTRALTRDQQYINFFALHFEFHHFVCSSQKNQTRYTSTHTQLHWKRTICFGGFLKMALNILIWWTLLSVTQWGASLHDSFLLINKST